MSLKRIFKILFQNIFFSKWQAILSNFDFKIEFVKGETNSLQIFSLENFYKV
jgi:hypothetical protein